MSVSLNVQNDRNTFGHKFEWKTVSKNFDRTKSKYCLFCFKEKYFIINYTHQKTVLNKLIESELISKCRHENEDMC